MSALRRHATYLLTGNSSEETATSDAAPMPPPAPLSRAASHGIIRSAAPEHPRMRTLRHQDAGTGRSPLKRRPTPYPTALDNATQPPRELQVGWGTPVAQERQRSPTPSPEEEGEEEEEEADWPIPWELYSTEIPRMITMGNLELVFVARNSRNERVVVNPLPCFDVGLGKGWELTIESRPLPKSPRSYLDILMWIMVLFMFTVMVVDFMANGRYKQLL